MFEGIEAGRHWEEIKLDWPQASWVARIGIGSWATFLRGGSSNEQASHNPDRSADCNVLPHGMRGFWVFRQWRVLEKAGNPGAIKCPD
jgi:hypothetical protein